MCIRDSIVSIAPGKSLSWFDEMFGKSLKVIRTMPNTPAMVGEGTVSYTHQMCIRDRLWRVRCKALRLHVCIYFVQKIFKLLQWK